MTSIYEFSPSQSMDSPEFRAEKFELELAAEARMAANLAILGDATPEQIVQTNAQARIIEEVIGAARRTVMNRNERVGLD